MDGKTIPPALILSFECRHRNSFCFCFVFLLGKKFTTRHDLLVDGDLLEFATRRCAT
jgi:hypothetical protein